MSTPEDSSGLFYNAMAGAETPEDQAEIQKAYYEGNADQINAQLDEARRALTEGSMADLIDVVNQDAAARAAEAVKRLSGGPEDRYKIDG